MAVKCTWRLLQQHGIVGTVVERPVEALGWREAQKKIHVDIIGAFFKLLRRCFINCDGDDQQAMIYASNKFLRLIGDIVPSNRSILYLDGNSTLERDLAHRIRLTDDLNRQKSLEQELLECEAHPDRANIPKLDIKARNLFRFTEDMKQVLYQTALQRDWTIIVTAGEAEVEIGKLGGIVLTGDSDMLFYPNISIVIRQMNDHQFNVYYKSSILAKLQISSNAFTAMGILASNDYEDHHLGCVSLISKGLNVYEIVSKIHQSCQQRSIKDILETFINETNHIVKEAISTDYYANSYRVFVLQEEHLLPHNYDIRLGYLNTAAYYLKKIRKLQSLTH